MKIKCEDKVVVEKHMMFSVVSVVIKAGISISNSSVWLFPNKINTFSLSVQTETTANFYEVVLLRSWSGGVLSHADLSDDTTFEGKGCFSIFSHCRKIP